MDDRERVKAVVSQMIADGQDQATIEEFVRRAGAARAPGPVGAKPTPSGPGPWESGYQGAEDYGPPAETTGQKVISALKTGLGHAGSFAQGLNDRLMLGLPSKALIATGLQTPEQQQALRDQHPTTAALGSGTGMGLDAIMPGGAGEALSRTAATAVGRLAPDIEATMLGRLASATGQGAAVGGSYGAADAATHGQPIVPALGRGALLGGGAGLGGQGAGELARGGSKLLHLDPWIQRFADATDRGAYRDPAMLALHGGKEGIQQAAEQGLQRVEAARMARNDEAGQQYAANSAPSDTPVDPAVINAPIREAIGRNMDPDTGLPLRPSVDSKLRNVEAATPLGPGGPTMGGTLARRRALKADAAHGNPNPSPEQEASRDAYDALNEGIRQASPQQAAADEAFARHAAADERAGDILYRTEDRVAPNVRVAREQAGARTLGRVGDNNVPGLGAKSHLEELAAQDPKFAEALQYILDKKAQVGTAPSLHAELPTTLTGALHFAGLGPVAAQNARAIGGRLLDPALRFGADAASQTPRLVPGLEMFLPPMMERRQ